MEINGKQLDDAKVAEARERFDFTANWHKHISRGRLTFDELLERLSSDCNSFASIAEEHCVSRQSLHQTYNRYFRDLFPGRKSGRQRQRVCTLKRIKIAERDFVKEEVKPWIRDIVSDAESNGFSVRRAKSSHEALAGCNAKSTFKQHEILINGRRCSLRLVRHIIHVRGGYRGYSHISLATNNTPDFLIVRQEVTEARTFVIPVSDLFERFGMAKKIQFCLPVERISKYPAVNDRADTGWWQYENAWHLLKA